MAPRAAICLVACVGLALNAEAFAPISVALQSTTKAGLTAAPHRNLFSVAPQRQRTVRLSMSTTEAPAKSKLTADGRIIGVVGATGAVGEEIVSVLHRRGFPVKELRLFSSARSAGKVSS